MKPTISKFREILFFSWWYLIPACPCPVFAVIAFCSGHPLTGILALCAGVFVAVLVAINVGVIFKRDFIEMGIVPGCLLSILLVILIPIVEHKVQKDHARVLQAIRREAQLKEQMHNPAGLSPRRIR